MIRTFFVLCALFLAAAPAQAQTAAPPAEEPAWVRSDLQRMVQPDNAGRLTALKALLDERQIPYTIQTFAGSTESKGVAGHNVVITLGDGPRDLVLGAHYDAVIQANGRALDGVVDNGASVVALVQAAQALSAYNAKHRIIIIFFDQEELGLLGSKAWLAQADRSRIDAAVIFDVNAYGDSVIFGGMKSDTQGQVRASMNAVCARRLLDCMRFDTFPPSDDRPFADAGIPVVSVGQQPAADAHQMWLLMHKGPQAGLAQGVAPRVFTLIHTPADVMGAVEPAAVNRAFELAFDLIQDLDDRYALPAQ
jgi:Zn-dependent M28 family amino/carboxypeptidase